ncbi:MAG: hypothetical protein C0597_07330 [Marinilabiliales bacterium]|nr:MAG: hypothetical protein C0597_07330 [Marinilabiliales bacterium]
MKKAGLLFFVFISWNIFYCASLYSQKVQEDFVLFDSDFFLKDELLEIVLEFDVKKLMNEKDKEEYLPATLKYYTNDSVEISGKVRVKTRGESRKRQCHLPPYWINIKGSGLYDKKGFDSNKIKVVSHCRAGKIYSHYLLNEYFIYKAYNVISENSFRVRLIKVRYVDTGRKNKETIGWAFMIEPDRMLASRIHAIPIKVNNLSFRHTDSSLVDIMCFFQYMIGNTDFSIRNRHNIKLYKYKDHTRPDLIPVAYDFDFSGLINAAYANPAEELNLTGVRERYYIGECRSDKQFDRVIEFYKKSEDKIYDLIENADYLDKRAKIEARKYLEGFFLDLSRNNFKERKLYSSCYK